MKSICQNHSIEMHEVNLKKLGETIFSPFSPFIEHLFTLSYQYPLAFISTINDGSEPFPTNVPEPELPKIHPKSWKFYDFTVDAISACTICTLQLLWCPSVGGNPVEWYAVTLPGTLPIYVRTVSPPGYVIGWFSPLDG